MQFDKRRANAEPHLCELAGDQELDGYVIMHGEQRHTALVTEEHNVTHSSDRTLSNLSVHCSADNRFQQLRTTPEPSKISRSRWLSLIERGCSMITFLSLPHLKLFFAANVGNACYLRGVTLWTKGRFPLFHRQAAVTESKCIRAQAFDHCNDWLLASLTADAAPDTRAKIRVHIDEAIWSDSDIFMALALRVACCWFGRLNALDIGWETNELPFVYEANDQQYIWQNGLDLMLRILCRQVVSRVQLGDCKEIAETRKCSLGCVHSDEPSARLC
nr:hypothetical protein CFP56_21702 [Quercus suber]